MILFKLEGGLEVKLVGRPRMLTVWGEILEPLKCTVFHPEHKHFKYSCTVLLFRIQYRYVKSDFSPFGGLWYTVHKFTRFYFYMATVPYSYTAPTVLCVVLYYFHN